jgi:hypothetical protein
MQLFMYGVVLACVSYAMVMVIAHTTNAVRARTAQKKEEEIKRIIDLNSK